MLNDLKSHKLKRTEKLTMTLLLIQDVVEVVKAPQVVKIPANVEDQLPGLKTRVSFSGEF